MKYLFIDRRNIQLIDENINWKFHSPVKDTRPVLEPVMPWEGERLHIWSPPVFSHETGKWRMWYIGGDEMLPLYAESEDGLNWHRPELDRVQWKGEMRNNIINLGFKGSGKENRIVLLRDEEESDPSKRYKGLTRISGHLIPFCSPDGLDWRKIDAGSVPSNDEYRLGKDNINGLFIATAKGSPVPEFGRAVSLSVSSDFLNWSDRRLVFQADEKDLELGKERIREAVQNPDRRSPLINQPELYHTDVYNMPVFTYDGMYLALPVIFNHSGLYWYSHPDDAPPRLRSNQDGILYPSLAVSDDLYAWRRPCREPFIPLSSFSETDNYDCGAIHANPPVVSGDELWFYYTGTRFTHIKQSVIEKSGLSKKNPGPLGAIFRARMRIDGFASLSAGERPAHVLSKPVEVDGSSLYVNVDAAGGELRAELRDADTGSVIPGYSLGDIFCDRYLYSDDGFSRRLRFGTGARLEDDPQDNTSIPLCQDSTAAPMHWENGSDLAALRGRRVRISFYLKNTDLFAFWFSPE